VCKKLEKSKNIINYKMLTEKVDNDLIYKYTLKEDILLSGNIGFGLITYDVENGSANNNGTYSYSLKIDSSEVFNYACNRFAFDQTRYINAHLDYVKMKKNKDRYQRCFLLPGNKIKHYKTDERNGIFEFNDTLNHTIIIKAIDFKNNSSTFEIKCKSSNAAPIIKDQKTKDLFQYNKPNHCLFPLFYQHLNPFAYQIIPHQ
jgi:hypothetical protein